MTDEEIKKIVEQNEIERKKRRIKNRFDKRKKEINEDTKRLKEKLKKLEEKKIEGSKEAKELEKIYEYLFEEMKKLK
jgi:hypothetical protein